MRKYLLHIIAFLSITIFAQATHIPIIKLTDSSQYILQKQHIGFFEDTSTLLTIYNFISPVADIDFTPLHTIKENRGFSSSAFWLKLDFKNDGYSTHVYHLIFEYPLLNDIRFFKVQDSIIKDVVITGENFPYNSRQIQNRHFIFKLEIPANAQITYFIRIFNIGEATRIPISLSHIDNTAQIHARSDFFSSIYYGYILFSIIFLIFMYVEFKRLHFLFLALYTTSMAFFLFIIDGYAFQFLWPNFTFISNISIIFFAILSSISMVVFTNIFLETHTVIKNISKFLYAIALLVFIWNLFPYPYNYYSFITVNIFSVLIICFITTLAIYKYYKQKNHYNTLFVLSLFFIFTTVLIYVCRNFAIFDIPIISSNSIKLGFAGQITLLSVATITQFREFFQKSNKFLEDMIQKRTILISNQNAQLQEQNKKIAQQYKEIKQSMTYAKRLQNAILPNKYKFSSVFKDHFILYKPRDIVSGDFYWISEKRKKTYIVTADCTGHGIPGAFLSMLGISFLNQIVSKNHDISPHDILHKLGLLFSETINNHDDHMTRDSMDISVCLIDHSSKTMEYAGAYNPIYIIRNHELYELTVDKFSLHKDYASEMPKFTNKIFTLQENDKVFMFTDGYADQFGGDLNKRFSKRRFKQILTSSSNKTMPEQKTILEETHETWKGKQEQVDDILILGFEI
ncbi:MAG TPA: 7TM diverse intracellular signaling domain-containing protein [Bacteroidales bacterium]|nr:MAG: 7TMR-DISM extracellular 2 [Bacteroidetes bacterium ADurb.Bin217]HPM11866.1 7TM diverse intracellular signaling domain-containing protein [Bacteroidales bacterium]